jgi:hypothetical protein
VTGTNKVPAATVTQNAIAVLGKRAALTDGANVAVNLALGNDFFLAANGSRTINNFSNQPQASYYQFFTVPISNITVGAIVTT